MNNGYFSILYKNYYIVNIKKYYIFFNILSLIGAALHRRLGIFDVKDIRGDGGMTPLLRWWNLYSCDAYSYACSPFPFFFITNLHARGPMVALGKGAGGEKVTDIAPGYPPALFEPAGLWCGGRADALLPQHYYCRIPAYTKFH